MRGPLLRTVQRGTFSKQTSVQQNGGGLILGKDTELELKKQRFLHSLPQQTQGYVQQATDWTQISKYYRSCDKFSNINTMQSLENWINSFNSNIAPKPVTRLETDSEVFVVGDVHGDIHKLLDALTLAGLIEDHEGEIAWIGGSSIVVQLGDLLDRGDDDIAAILLLRYIHCLAQKDGGAIISLNGNHEVLNGNQRFDTVSLESFRKACKMMGSPIPDDEIELYKAGARARSALFQSGTLLSQELSRNPTILVINDVIFAHGGVLPEHVKEGFEKINRSANQWYMGELQDEMAKKNPLLCRPIACLRGDNSVVWNRTYSKEIYDDEQYDSAYQLIRSVLQTESASHHIVAHTPQTRGINPSLEGLVWRVDIGMSGKVLNSDPQILKLNWLKGHKNPQIQMLK